MITRAQLIERRQHEVALGCRVSQSGLIDKRCGTCRQLDDQIARETVKGWEPTMYDRRFLRSLRIDLS